MDMSPEKINVDRMTLEDLKAVGGEKIKQEVWEWINGGTETGLTLQRNRLAIDNIMLRLRVIHGLEAANTQVSLLGQTVKTPIAVAPFANMARVHPQAEIAIAKGAEKAGVMIFVGSDSSRSTQEVVEAVNTPVAWIGEPLNDRKKLLTLMGDAERAGCRAVGLCIDDYMGIKIKDRSVPLKNRSLSAEEIRSMRKETSLPFVLKGVMTVEDGSKAVDAGVDAIVVSNHGGRVLDCCQSTVEVLPEIVKALGAKIEILVDGGFRRGTDILKALALGAKGVLVGRPICWGLAAAGAEGVARVLEMMTSELIRAMLLTNVADASHVPRDAIVLETQR